MRRSFRKGRRVGIAAALMMVAGASIARGQSRLVDDPGLLPPPPASNYTVSGIEPAPGRVPTVIVPPRTTAPTPTPSAAPPRLLDYPLPDPAPAAAAPAPTKSPAYQLSPLSRGGISTNSQPTAHRQPTVRTLPTAVAGSKPGVVPKSPQGSHPVTSA